LVSTWAYVPGNHDNENDRYTREDLHKFASSQPYFLSKDTKNFDYEIEYGPIHLYFIDSNEYAPNNSFDPFQRVIYDWIHDDQIEWYKNIEPKGEIGLCFYHIPVPEFRDAKILKGSQCESVCCPDYNSGFFNAAVVKGDIQAMFVGHDHLNDYVSEKDNIWLCYGRVSGFTEPACYFQEEQLTSNVRGSRIIEYDSETKELSTWIETSDSKLEDSFISRKIKKKLRTKKEFSNVL